MVKMVTLGVPFTFFRILSRVSLLKVSTPLEIRTMYLRPSRRSTRSKVSYRASKRLVSLKPGIWSVRMAPKTSRLSWVKSVSMWGFMS